MNATAFAATEASSDLVRQELLRLGLLITEFSSPLAGQSAPPEGLVTYMPRLVSANKTPVTMFLFARQLEALRIRSVLLTAVLICDDGTCVRHTLGFEESHGFELKKCGKLPDKCIPRVSVGNVSELRFALANRSARGYAPVVAPDPLWASALERATDHANALREALA